MTRPILHALTLLLPLAACTGSDPKDGDDTSDGDPAEEVEPTTDYARPLLAGCAMTAISDGWNTGSDDYIDTFEFDDRGNWTYNTWFGPYHGETEVDWFEWQEFDDAGFLTSRHYEYDGDTVVYDVTQDESGFPAEVAAEYERSGDSDGVWTFTYGDLEGYLDAVRTLPVTSVYRPTSPATRVEVDDPPLGSVDEWTEYEYDDDWQLVRMERSTSGASAHNVEGEWTWEDGVPVSYSQENLATGDTLTRVYAWDDDGRLSWMAAETTQENVWGEYTENYTWDCP